MVGLCSKLYDSSYTSQIAFSPFLHYLSLFPGPSVKVTFAFCTKKLTTVEKTSDQTFLNYNFLLLINFWQEKQDEFSKCCSHVFTPECVISQLSIFCSSASKYFYLHLMQKWFAYLTT